MFHATGSSLGSKYATCLEILWCYATKRFTSSSQKPTTGSYSHFTTSLPMPLRLILIYHSTSSKLPHTIKFTITLSIHLLFPLCVPTFSDHLNIRQNKNYAAHFYITFSYTLTLHLSEMPAKRNLSAVIGQCLPFQLPPV